MNAVNETMASAAPAGGNGHDRNSQSASGLNRLVERSGLDQLDRYQLNKALGWFSIGLGLTQLLAPRALGRFIGAGDGYTTLLRLCGAREVASGLGLLSERAPASSAISRVAGDVMDLALLGAALRSPDAKPARLLAAATTVLGVTAIDMYAAGLHTREAVAQAEEPVRVKVSLAINSPAQKLYAFWRDFENLPRFMERLQSVTRKDEKVSHWVAKAPIGTMTVEWDSEVVDDQPDTLISWRTLPGSQVSHRGSVLFEPAGDGKGTIVYVDMEYDAPGGKLGAVLAKIFGEDPRMQITRDLRALKQLLEAGEVATTRGQSSGMRSLLGRTLTRRES